MVAPNFPRASEQYALYRAVLDAAGDKPVTFRTLDIGGDKVLPYMRNDRGGESGARLARDPPRPRPAGACCARSCARCCAPPAAARCKIMFPMVATVDEFDQAKALVERELTHLRRHGHKLPDAVEVGSMVEVPSLLYQLDELLEHVDFLSVGSNDLMQFLYAADRGNPRVADRFDPLSAPVLRALKDIADAGARARQAGDALRRAGVAAARRAGAVALGYRSLSLSPSAIGPVKAMLLELDCRKAAEFLCALIEKPTAGGVSIRAQLETFAADSGLQL